MKRFLALLFSVLTALTTMGCGSGQTAASMAPPLWDDDAVPMASQPAPSGGTAKSDAQSGGGSGGGTSGASRGGGAPDAAAEAALLSAAAVLADYPAAASLPNEEDYLLPDGGVDFERYNRDYQAWAAYQEARPELPGNTDRLNGFFRSGTARFLSGGTENRVCSPLNIYMALCMTAEITDGESRGQILRLLGADSLDALRRQANQIWNALYTDDGTSSVIPGSSLWMNEKVRFREDTLRRVAENYYASSFSGDPADKQFTAALQAWLSQQTRGLLAQQAGNVSLTPDTVLALASTLYFKAPWLSSFEEALTRPDVFHAPSGDMSAPYLHKTVQHTTFYAGTNFTAMSLPMDAGRMWLVLPNKGTTADALLDAGTLPDLLNSPEEYVSARSVNVALSLPKFDVAKEQDLIDGLKAMGVTDVFDHTKSNFTPLTDVTNLEISKIQHAARVKIDEDGCEAAAFTVAMVELTAAAPGQTETITFTLDRPFLFAVAGNGNLPLFAGVVNVPEKA